MPGVLEFVIPSNTEKAALEGQHAEGPITSPSMTSELCAGAALVSFTETHREFSIQRGIIRSGRISKIVQASTCVPSRTIFSCSWLLAG